MVGVVAWLEAREHAVRMVGRDVPCLIAQLAEGDPTQAPWWTTVVGAPKARKQGYTAQRLRGLNRQGRSGVRETAAPDGGGLQSRESEVTVDGGGVQVRDDVGGGNMAAAPVLGTGDVVEGPSVSTACLLYTSPSPRD